MNVIQTKPNDLINKIVLLTEYNSIDNKRHYRFNDIINHSGHYWKESTQFILNQDHLKGSILRTYIECCPDNNLYKINPDKFKLLYHIIENKIKNNHYVLPSSDELVIHMRTGDVVELDGYLKKDYINIIQKYIYRYNIKKVTFCTAFHYGNNVTQGDWIYTDEKHNLNKIKLNEIFTKVLNYFKHLHLHLQIDVKSSSNIDEDFIYMVMSTYFVEDNGGFSNLIAKLIAFKNRKL
jgi:hypothetical protein